MDYNFYEPSTDPSGSHVEIEWPERGEKDPFLKVAIRVQSYAECCTVLFFRHGSMELGRCLPRIENI